MSGWIEAGTYVFAIAVLSIVYVVSARLGAHPLAFVLLSMIISAVVMLIATGLGPDWRRLIAMPRSWLVGFGTIGMEVSFFVLLSEVPPAQSSLMIRLTIGVSMMVGLLVFGRRPVLLQIVGAAILSLAIAPILFRVPADRLTTALAATAGCIAMFNVRNFSAEFHPANRAARTIRDKVRLTGLFVSITSAAGLAVVGMGAVLIARGLLPASPMVPTLADLTHGPTWLLATLCGSAILTLMAFLNYSSVVKITTENFAAMTAFTPIATLAVQSLAVAAGLMAPVAFDPILLTAMAVVAAGALVMLTGVRRARRLRLAATPPSPA